MGTWGIGIFENEHAARWLADFEDSGSFDVVDALFVALEADAAGYVEADMGARALAAAEAVAHAFGQEDLELEPLTRKVMAYHALGVRALPDIITAAERAVGEVCDNVCQSELLEQWDSQDKTSEFLIIGAALQARLGKARKVEALQ